MYGDTCTSDLDCGNSGNMHCKFYNAYSDTNGYTSTGYPSSSSSYDNTNSYTNLGTCECNAGFTYIFDVHSCVSGNDRI